VAPSGGPHSGTRHHVTAMQLTASIGRDATTPRQVWVPRVSPLSPVVGPPLSGATVADPSEKVPAKEEAATPLQATTPKTLHCLEAKGCLESRLRRHSLILSVPNHVRQAFDVVLTLARHNFLDAVQRLATEKYRCSIWPPHPKIVPQALLLPPVRAA
jgi:hypothetical protein